MSAALDVGSEIGQYRIEDLLGQGGMGVVFRARHVTLDRIVAVKVLGPWLQGNRRAKERFLRESRLAAELEHPNIVTVYDAGEDQGYVYIALRLVDGVELHDELEHGPLEPGRGPESARPDRLGARRRARRRAGAPRRQAGQHPSPR
ncbi:MAG TPA: protein kinase [Solirubrobacteraceae bacterium]|nr:protein kinase [Solirubrobacteraceae bacterium]